MNRRPPRYTRTAPLLPSTTLFRSVVSAMSGTTDRLLHLAALAERDDDCFVADLHEIGDRYAGTAKRLVSGERLVTLLDQRSEEHTSELQSLMRISYAVFCLKKKKKENNARIVRMNS